MVLVQNVTDNLSRGAFKSRLFLKRSLQLGGLKYKIMHRFKPFARDDFLIAHDPNYVDAFLTGKKPLCESNFVKWSEDFVETVMYENASIYYAIKHSIENPTQITFSPTGGFHHARPQSGQGYCTFSGQVIASIKLWREFGLRGVYFDLDAHRGDSIERSRFFAPEINEAVPKYCNLNPVGEHAGYLDDLKSKLVKVEEALLNGEIGYAVMCHGADSHEDDHLQSGHLTTEEWKESARLVYGMIARVEEKLQKPIPLTVTLFGGYRYDDFNHVLDLHHLDLSVCKEILMENSL